MNKQLNFFDKNNNNTTSNKSSLLAAISQGGLALKQGYKVLTITSDNKSEQLLANMQNLKNIQFTTQKTPSNSEILIIIENALNFKKALDEYYYNFAQSAVPDSDYDQLKHILLKILSEINMQHLITVGAPTAKHLISEQITHKYRMYSLANAYSISDLDDFVQSTARYLQTDKHNIELVGQLKIDGNAFTAHYNNGKIVYAATRGDGAQGENITLNMQTVLPQQISCTNPIWITGECYVDKHDFEEINEALIGGKKFSNPRNYTAGSLRLLNQVEEFKARKIKYLTFGLFGEQSANYQTEADMLSFLHQQGFATVDHKILPSDNSIESYIAEIDSLRAKVPYLTDGIVFKLNNKNMQQRLGYTSHHPKYAISYKFPAQQVTTTLLAVEYQVGRTGSITPVAILKPVTVEGITIEKATLHNFEQIKLLNIKINHRITVERAGEVIPHIVKSEEDGSISPVEIIQPTSCPSCNQPLNRQKEGDIVLRCLNHENCQEQQIHTLHHFVSKKALNIKGMGLKHIRLFFKTGIVRSCKDIFDLITDQSKAYQIAALDGWKEKSLNNLLNAIDEARTVSLSKLIYAMGIRHIGLETAKLIAQEFTTQEQLVQAISTQSIYIKMANIDGIGSEATESLRCYMAKSTNLQQFTELLQILNVQYALSDDKHQKFANKTIMFTGSLQLMSRDEAKAVAEKHGFKVKSGVSKNLDYLVVGEKPGSKKTKAQELGITIINEEEWNSMLQQ